MTRAEAEERKAPLKMADVQPGIIEMLNKGEISTLNLSEWLSVNHLLLIDKLLTDFGDRMVRDACIQALEGMTKRSVLGSILTVGRTLSACEANDIIDFLGNHTSDSARSYSVCAIGADNITIGQKLERTQKFAEDAHFGVREMAWLGLRDSVEKELDTAIDILSIWAENENPNTRRFASEVTRPRGVWCRHLTRLKTNPEVAAPILVPLKSDISKYVQDSVANWLNDASKTRPDWVLDICNNWSAASDTKETQRIVHRALRTLRKPDI